MATRRRTRRIPPGAVALSLLALTLAAPSTASAYQHTQNCTFKPAYEGCYDVQGQYYNPWTFGSTRISGAGSGSPIVNGTCIKAVTQAGSNKSGDRCNSSSQTTTTFQASPDSRVYGYWGGSGGTLALEVIGRT